MIIGDPRTTRRPSCCGRTAGSSQSLGGRYVTAGDVGTYVADMDVVARDLPLGHGTLARARGRGRLQRPHRLRRVPGDARRRPGPLGRAVPRRPAGGGRGVGKVGPHLVGHLLADGADVVVTDVDPDRARPGPRGAPRRRGRAATPPPWSADRSTSTPLARSAARSTTRRWPPCTAAVVCGAANNQLAHAGTAAALADRGVLYAPDFLVNAGGVIQVADELAGFDMARAQATAARIFDTTLAVLAHARRGRRCCPPTAADRLAEERMAAGPWADRLFPGLGPGSRSSRARVNLYAGAQPDRRPGSHRHWHPTGTQHRHPGPDRRSITYTSTGAVRPRPEGVEPWGAAGRRPSRPRSPASSSTARTGPTSTRCGRSWRAPLPPRPRLDDEDDDDDDPYATTPARRLGLDDDEDEDDRKAGWR